MNPRRGLAMGALLAATALGIPSPVVHEDQVVLVATRHARGLDLDPSLVWILAVGSDARPGEDMTRTRGDALQLIGMDTRTGAAAAIGIPRDSYVPIPGHGSNRVNAALAFGGPQLLARTVGDLVGIDADYVVVTRFPFFEEMVDDIGGITVTNPRRFSDPSLKPRGFAAGRLHLTGYGAMAFSRIRKSLPGGDFDRSRNQQRVLRGIQQRVANRADVPGFLEHGVLTVIQHTATDLGPAELFRLAEAVASVRPERITTCVVLGSIATIDGASVVRPNVAMARRLGAAARSDATLPRGC